MVRISKQLHEPYAVEHGLIYNQNLADLAEEKFNQIGITQAQADSLVSFHTEISAWLFDRRNYSLLQRLTLAMYWLGFGRSVGKR